MRPSTPAATARSRTRSSPSRADSPTPPDAFRLVDGGTSCRFKREPTPTRRLVRIVQGSVRQKPVAHLGRSAVSFVDEGARAGGAKGRHRVVIHLQEKLAADLQGEH